MTLLAVFIQRCVLFPLSFLLPRRGETWVFGAPQDAFSGNPKYLFLWMSEHRPDIRAVWLTGSPATVQTLRDRGYRCERRWSWAGVVAAASAKYHVVANDGSDTCFALTGGAQVLNLWHGVGIKNIVRGARIGRNAQLFARRRWPHSYVRSLPRFRRPAMVLSTSPVMSSHFARCFDVPEDRCPALGYPRLDSFVDEGFRDLCLSFGDYDALRALCAGRTVYLYAPTLRDDDRDLLAQAVPDWTALSAALRPTNGLLLLKLHPFTSRQISPAVADLDNVAVWPEGLDLYPVLGDIDCLITDYSSMLYDYIAIAGSGVVIYAFDYDRYISKDRDFAFPLEDNILGQRADSFEQLCAVLSSGAALADLPEERLATIRTRFWGSPHPPRKLASAAIAQFVCEGGADGARDGRGAGSAEEGRGSA